VPSSDTSAAVLGNQKNDTAVPTASDTSAAVFDQKTNDTVVPSSDTSVIITSSLIPTHPSTWMIDQTFESIRFLKGLSPEAPIYIVIDGLPPEKMIDDNQIRLDQYVVALKAKYGNTSHVTILPSPVHLHLAGSLNMAMAHVDTQFIYAVQHDYPFSRDIDHVNLAKSMTEYPEIIRCVRFNFKPFNRDPFCNTTQADHVNGLSFMLTAKWSDK
jgi:hypothetical protein